MSNGEASPPGVWNVGALYQHFAAIIMEQEKQRASSFNDLQAQIDRRIEVTNDERKEAEKHLCSMMEAGDRRLETHINLQRENVAEAKSDIEKRLIALNELRKAVEEDRRMFIGREEAEAKHQSLSEQIVRAESAMREVYLASSAKTEQKLDTFEERIKRMESNLDQRAGGEQLERRRQQTNQPWQIWIASIFVTLALFAIGIMIGSPTI